MNRNRLTALFILGAVLLTGCGNSASQSQVASVASAAPAASSTQEAAANTLDGADSASAASEPSAPSTGGKTLITYFSVMETDGVDTVGGASRVVSAGNLFGNNEYVAQLIQRETGGDVFAIETVQDYPTTHQPLLEFGHAEQASGTLPELAAHIKNFDEYDTVFIGFPIWNADLPMPLYSFFEEYDFSGKTIIPFTVHGGSSFAGTRQTIAELEPGATIVNDGLAISRNSVAEAEASVVDWVRGLGLNRNALD